MHVNYVCREAECTRIVGMSIFLTSCWHIALLYMTAPDSVQTCWWLGVYCSFQFTPWSQHQVLIPGAVKTALMNLYPSSKRLFGRLTAMPEITWKGVHSTKRSNMITEHLGEDSMIQEPSCGTTTHSAGRVSLQSCVVHGLDPTLWSRGSTMLHTRFRRVEEVSHLCVMWIPSKDMRGMPLPGTEPRNRMQHQKQGCETLVITHNPGWGKGQGLVCFLYPARRGSKVEWRRLQVEFPVVLYRKILVHHLLRSEDVDRLFGPSTNESVEVGIFQEFLFY